MKIFGTLLLLPYVLASSMDVKYVGPNMNKKSASLWDELTAGLAAWGDLQLDGYFAVNAGDANGTRYKYVSPGFSMTDELAGASLSKWPAAIMISGLVADGTMSYDDKPSKYLKWWTTDEKSPLSRTTLRQLLSFTSGFTEDTESYCMRGFEDCAEIMYNKLVEAGHIVEPGTSFQYKSCHLQFAGAMAVAASGKDIQTLFEEYLYKPFNMVGTSWSPKYNPSIAGGIRTTGEDFENMLHKMLTYEVLPEKVCKEMETDLTKQARPSGDGWFGHYGMGHWWECMGYGKPSERDKLSKACLDAHIQAGPGEFGYYPLLDRSGGDGKRPPYYFQVVLQEPDSLSGIPEYLRIVAKPIVDLILEGVDPEKVTNLDILKRGGGILRRDIDYIKGELGECTCEKSKGEKDEPYASLQKGLPKDEPEKNRQDILDNGDGITLADIYQVQQKLGKCTCSGRKTSLRKH